MNREIKFRVWHLGEFLYWSAGDKSNYLWDVVSDYDSNFIEQYTGLKDKNGVEIYEGDIVYIAGLGNLEVCSSDYYLGFVFKESEGNRWEYQEIITDIENIIGNMHKGEIK